MTLELLKSIINRNIKQLEIAWRTYQEEPNIWQSMGGSNLMSEIDDKVDLLHSILNEYEDLVKGRIQILHKTSAK